MSARLLFLGIALLVGALLLVLLSTGLRGPLNPECAGRPWAAGCFDLLATALMVLALPAAGAGGTLVAIWMGRRDA